MAKKTTPKKRQEVIGARLGTIDMLDRLKPMLSREKGVPISAALALEVALKEALAKRGVNL
jgi:hypothetical protein